jgi:glycosyltransferase involved in cell wall biosynthesis
MRLGSRVTTATKGARVIRVLQLLTSTAPGGGPRQVLHLVRHLPAGEFQVAVAGPWDGRYAADLRAVGIELAEAAVDSLRAFPLTLRRVRRLVRDTRADVVHTHGKGAGLYGRVAARLAGVPSVHTFHGIHYESYSGPGRLVYLAFERALARITHTVINVSRTQDAEALRLGVARPGRSAVVVNGIDVDELGARPVSKREGLGLSADDDVLGCVARFDPVKRHDLLVNALALVARRHPRAVLLLIGEGPEKARIDRLARELDARVVSPGAIGWDTNVYSSCDLYVVASSKEGLPLAPLEAMASGLAVIATDVPGHRDVVVPETTGLLVPPGSGAAGLAAAIESLLDDPERRRRMGQAGRERVMRDFTLQSMLARTAEVYRAAAASRRASRRS